jgi:hypothetical protein
MTYVRWGCLVTVRLCGSGSRCLTILHMILNRAIRRYRIIDYVVKSHLKYLMSFEKMLNLTLIALQPIPPLCGYKVWIDTERGVEVKHYLCNMVELNIMEDEFCARRMKERKRTAYFAMQHEMERKEYEEKREEERVRKYEKARRAKEAYARGGENALMKAKWPRLTLD